MPGPGCQFEVCDNIQFCIVKFKCISKIVNICIFSRFDRSVLKKRFKISCYRVLSPHRVC